MAWRTPSSLKWLIVKRARLAGTLDAVEKESIELKARLAVLEARAESSRRNLAAIDQALTLHDIRVEPEDISPVRPKGRKNLFSHGLLSRHILRALRQEEGWLSTSDIVLHVVLQLGDVDYETYKIARIAVRRRLRNLLIDQVVERDVPLDEQGHHDGATEAKWRLPER